MPGGAKWLLQAVEEVFATVIGMGPRRARPTSRLVRNVTRFLHVAGAAAAVTLAIPADANAAPPAPLQVLVTPVTSTTTAAWSINALGGQVQLVHDGTVQALIRPQQLARLRRSSAVASVAPAPVGSADAVTSEGLARIGAEIPQRQGLDGSSVRIAILDQAFGPMSD